MKTIITLLSILAFASVANATATFNDSATTVIGGGIYKVSKGVTLTATATSSAYSAISGHLNGDKEFGTASTDPKIFSKTKATSNTATSCGTATYDFSTWTAQ